MLKDYQPTTHRREGNNDDDAIQRQNTAITAVGLLAK